MREGTIRILTIALALLLAGSAAVGESVWISDKGEEHKIGAHAIFLDADGDSFDLSELEDGETKVFGSGDKQITASRDGDTIAIDRPEGGDDRAIRIECEVDRDTCKVMTFGENDEKIALMIKKRHAGHHLVTVDEDVMFGEDGEATITITQVGDCEDDGETDCIGKQIEFLDGDSLSGEMIVKVIASVGDGDVSKNVWISDDGPHHGHHAMMVTDGATQHDLSELYDGETRIFGYGERQVTAVREGDKVSVSRLQSDDDDDVLVTCEIGRDRCHVLTYDDDPEKVAVMIAKTSGCGAGDDCSNLLRLHMRDGHEEDTDVSTIRRIEIVREEDD